MNRTTKPIATARTAITGTNTENNVATALFHPLVFVLYIWFKAIGLNIANTNNAIITAITSLARLPAPNLLNIGANIAFAILKQ